MDETTIKDMVKYKDECTTYIWNQKENVLPNVWETFLTVVFLSVDLLWFAIHMTYIVFSLYETIH